MYANYGGTRIYEPLKEIFDQVVSPDCACSHIYLLTDGAIWDTEKVVDLVAKNSSIKQRVHTFGVGHGASEELIKQVAFKGFGHYQFIYDESELEERVISAVSKTRLNYKILQSVTLSDDNGEVIETEFTKVAEPMLEDALIDMSCLLPAKQTGKIATRFLVEILDPNTMDTQRVQGQIQNVVS